MRRKSLKRFVFVKPRCEPSLFILGSIDSWNYSTLMCRKQWQHKDERLLCLGVVFGTRTGPDEKQPDSSSSPTLYDNDDGIIFISSTTFFYCFQERIKLIILENYFEGEGLYKRNEHSNDRALELIMDCNSLFPVADMIGMVQLLRNGSICVQYWSDCVHLPSFSLIFLPRNWIWKEGGVGCFAVLCSAVRAFMNLMFKNIIERGGSNIGGRSDGHEPFQFPLSPPLSVWQYGFRFLECSSNNGQPISSSWHSVQLLFFFGLLQCPVRVRLLLMQSGLNYHYRFYKNHQARAHRSFI